MGRHGLIALLAGALALWLAAGAAAVDGGAPPSSQGILLRGPGGQPVRRCTTLEVDGLGLAWGPACDLMLGTEATQLGSVIGDTPLELFGGSGPPVVSCAPGMIYVDRTAGVLYLCTATDTWASATGTVSGPASAVDNEVARFDGASGTVIQAGTGCLLDDTGRLVGPCAPRSLVGVGSCMPITAGAVAYMAPGTCLDPDEADVAQPVHSAVVLDRLACRTSASIGTGNSITVQMRVGPCTALAAASAQCILTGGPTPSSCTSSASDAVPAGECYSLGITASTGLVAPVDILCSLDRVGS